MQQQDWLAKQHEVMCQGTDIKKRPVTWMVIGRGNSKTGTSAVTQSTRQNDDFP